MRHLFDFGISQEDPQTEFHLLDIKAGDRLLCIASGGEIPLSLFTLQPHLHITAVDVSEAQLFLSRLKWHASRALPFPLNGAFLGYRDAGKHARQQMYIDQIRGTLSREEQSFWDARLAQLEKGIIHAGRFEKYIRALRRIAGMAIGRSNIERLLQSTSLIEQAAVFDQHIATRAAVKYLFKIAFHPLIYKNRGVSEKGLIHTREHPGDLFLQKFRSFCVSTPAHKNYFLHYFLRGVCLTETALPEYLYHITPLSKPDESIHWKCSSLTDELRHNEPGTFNKIHLSNIGDWMSTNEFAVLFETIRLKGKKGDKVTYRYLHKNHLLHSPAETWPLTIKNCSTEYTDRFPFYATILLENNG